ncbi:MAG: DUF4396 domain-containing protein [Thermoproteota archaeon]|nr:DUF4396 domain-containing protein [Thermoproteota archaeon]
MRRNPEDKGTGHAHHNSSGNSSSLRWQTAKHALRCLIGCNIGEGIGAAIGFMLGWEMISTLILAVGLAFAIGYAFTIIPMLKTMPIRQAARVTVVGDTASIAAMEITENSLVFVIPGFMHAALTDALFWLGLGIILPAGYAVAYPAMYWAMKREQKREGMQTHHH